MYFISIQNLETWLTPLSATSLPHCITCQDVCVKQSHAGLPFSNFKQTQIAHQ